MIDWDFLFICFFVFFFLLQVHQNTAQVEVCYPLVVVVMALVMAIARKMFQFTKRAISRMPTSHTVSSFYMPY